jgi:hypothetical protein
MVQYYTFGTTYGTIYIEDFRITLEATPTFVAKL